MAARYWSCKVGEWYTEVKPDLLLANIMGAGIFMFTLSDVDTAQVVLIHD